MSDLSYAVKQNGFKLSVLKDGRIFYSLQFDSQITKVFKSGEELTIWLKNGATKVFSADGSLSYEYKSPTKLSKEEKKLRKQQFLSKQRAEK